MGFEELRGLGTTLDLGRLGGGREVEGEEDGGNGNGGGANGVVEVH